jgi:hypothetical protein
VGRPALAAPEVWTGRRAGKEKSGGRPVERERAVAVPNTGTDAGESEKQVLKEYARTPNVLRVERSRHAIRR